MKVQSIQFTPQALVSFTPRELDILMLLSAHHYDGECRAAGQVGGFLYGLNNGRAFNAKGTLDFRQLDILAKIMEQISALSADKAQLGSQIDHAIRTAQVRLKMVSGLEIVDMRQSQSEDYIEALKTAAEAQCSYCKRPNKYGLATLDKDSGIYAHTKNGARWCDANRIMKLIAAGISDRLPDCPPDCTNTETSNCPRCFEATGQGCNHGPICENCQPEQVQAIITQLWAVSRAESYASIDALDFANRINVGILLTDTTHVYWNMEDEVWSADVVEPDDDRGPSKSLTTKVSSRAIDVDQIAQAIFESTREYIRLKASNTL